MLPGKDGFEVASSIARRRPVRADSDADGARPPRGRPARVRSRAPTTTCRSRSSWRFCWRGCEGCSVAGGGASSRRLLPPPRPMAQCPTSSRSRGGRSTFSAMEIRAGDNRIRLTLMECDLLRYLVKNAGKPVSRKAILEDVWDLHESTDTRADRQLHRPAAPVPRGQPVIAQIPADGSRRRLQIRLECRRWQHVTGVSATWRTAVR